MFNKSLREREIEFEEMKNKSIKKATKEDIQYLELMDIIDRLNREKAELLAENYKLKLDNQELHNRLEVKKTESEIPSDPSMTNQYETEYMAGCEHDEDLKTMAEAYNNLSTLRY